MLSTARSFLLLAPLVFVVGAIGYLSGHPRAVESFAVYPFLSSVFAEGTPRHPLPRFLLVSFLFFMVPYLVTGALLSLSDMSLSVSRFLWSDRPEREPSGVRRSPLHPEARAALVGVSAVAAAILGKMLQGVAHGGELPGGVNVAPVFVSAVPFVALGIGLLGAILASVPRTLTAWSRRIESHRRGS